MKKTETITKAPIVATSAPSATSAD